MTGFNIRKGYIPSTNAGLGKKFLYLTAEILKFTKIYLVVPFGSVAELAVYSGDRFVSGIYVVMVSLTWFGIKTATEKSVYMYPAIDRSSLEPQINVPLSDVEPSAPNRADELCDALMEHIFDCDACIGGQEDTCAIYCSLREQIAQSGGPTRGALLVA